MSKFIERKLPENFQKTIRSYELPYSAMTWSIMPAVASSMMGHDSVLLRTLNSSIKILKLFSLLALNRSIVELRYLHDVTSLSSMANQSFGCSKSPNLHNSLWESLSFCIVMWKVCPPPNFQTLPRNLKGTKMDIGEEGRKHSMICKLC